MKYTLRKHPLSNNVIVDTETGKVVASIKDTKLSARTLRLWNSGIRVEN